MLLENGTLEMEDRIDKSMARKRLLSNIISLAILQGANYILPLVTVPYLVVTLGVEKFGVLAFAQAVIGYLNTLVDYGFNLSATRSVALNSHSPKSVSLILVSVMLIKMCLLCVAFLILFVLVKSFERVESEAIVYYMAFGGVIGNLLFPVWYYQGMEDMKYITYINILSKLLSTVAIFVLVHEGSDYALVPLLNSLGLVGGGLAALVIACRKLEICVPSFDYTKAMFKESTSLFISNASVSLFTASNTIILGCFASNTCVGIYAAMERLMMAIKYLYAPIYQGLFPWLAKKDRDYIIAFTARFFPFAGFFGLALTGVVVLFAHPLLTLIYRSEAISAYYPALQIFSLVSVFSATNLLFNYLFLNVMGEYRARLRILLAAGLFNVISGTLLAYGFGLFGIVCSVTATEALLLALGFWQFQLSRRGG